MADDFMHLYETMYGYDDEDEFMMCECGGFPCLCGDLPMPPRVDELFSSMNQVEDSFWVSRCMSSRQEEFLLSLLSQLRENLKKVNLVSLQNLVNNVREKQRQLKEYESGEDWERLGEAKKIWKDWHRSNDMYTTPVSDSKDEWSDAEDLTPSVEELDGNKAAITTEPDQSQRTNTILDTPMLDSDQIDRIFEGYESRTDESTPPQAAFYPIFRQKRTRR